MHVKRIMNSVQPAAGSPTDKPLQARLRQLPALQQRISGRWPASTAQEQPAEPWRARRAAVAIWSEQQDHGQERLRVTHVSVTGHVSCLSALRTRGAGGHAHVAPTNRSRRTPAEKVASASYRASVNVLDCDASPQPRDGVWCHVMPPSSGTPDAVRVCVNRVHVTAGAARTAPAAQLHAGKSGARRIRAQRSRQHSFRRCASPAASAHAWRQQPDAAMPGTHCTQAAQAPRARTLRTQRVAAGGTPAPAARRGRARKSLVADIPPRRGEAAAAALRCKRRR
jgi:hypothetical protein